ncbi:hypothetical protein PIB30_034140 [Stylosanthes scabra]|uniref:Ribonuclease H1 N-terminal domain-containing protein n=1 Tax=Stylosanthes scabra TaxID=79078 RepID=A0ABU6UCW6_9FABA|nr:hypothetical protein [Stylosanthes scabra]
MGECYVVFVGRNPDIYSSWAAAAPQVVGFKRAIDQSYLTMEEGVTAWMEFLQLGDRGASSSGSNSRGVHIKEEMEATGGGHFQNQVGSILQDAGKRHVSDGGFAGASGSVPHSPGDLATASAHGEGLAGDGNGLSSVMATIVSVEGRVSQLEVDKWKILMAMASMMEQIAGVLTKEAKEGKKRRRFHGEEVIPVVALKKLGLSP